MTLKEWTLKNGNNPINHKAVVNIIITEKGKGKSINAEQARALCPTWNKYSEYKAQNTANTKVKIENMAMAFAKFMLTQ